MASWVVHGHGVGRVQVLVPIRDQCLIGDDGHGQERVRLAGTWTYLNCARLLEAPSLEVLVDQGQGAELAKGSSRLLTAHRSPQALPQTRMFDWPATIQWPVVVACVHGPNVRESADFHATAGRSMAPGENRLKIPRIAQQAWTCSWDHCEFGALELWQRCGSARGHKGPAFV